MAIKLIKNLFSLAVFLAVFSTFPTPTNAQIIEPPFPGTTEGTGTYFEITDSEYLNIVLNSSENIKLRIESFPEMVTMIIEPVSSSVSSTQITLSGFEPSTTYYKYQDDYHNLTEFTANENGIYAYSQDLSKPHLVFIQPGKSTKFIKDDATGGDCSSIGIWDSATKTCTLTTDLNETIQIDDDGITLDGNGHTLTGSYTGGGVYFYKKTEITVKNLNIKNFGAGIYLRESNNNTISNINNSDNSYGILIYPYM
jgi:hypothetical protein